MFRDVSNKFTAEAATVYPVTVNSALCTGGAPGSCHTYIKTHFKTNKSEIIHIDFRRIKKHNDSFPFLCQKKKARKGGRFREKEKRGDTKHPS